MGLAGIIVLGVVGFGVLTLVAGIIDAEWQQRQASRRKRDKERRGESGV